MKVRERVRKKERNINKTERVDLGLGFLQEINKLD